MILLHFVLLLVNYSTLSNDLNSFLFKTFLNHSTWHSLIYRCKETNIYMQS